ncbi:helix-turn-helix domain-containing protein [Enterococcus sp. LJL90]
MEVQKNYFAVIPASVRYDTELKANAKLLYGEITALSNEKGYCWAGNQYFAELYGVSTRSITNWVRCLSDKGYIRVEIIYKNNTKEIEQRRIFIREVWKETSTPSRKKLPAPMEENFADNNTFNNTINNYIYKDDFELIWKSYPKKTLKQKAYQQFMKKVTDDKSLAQFRKGFSDYLEYIKLNSDWYSPAELFRWIRDERYNDEYDLTPKKQFGKRNQYKRRVEPRELSKPPVRELPSDEEISRMIREREDNEQL